MLVLNSKKCVFKMVFVFLMLINILNTNSIAVVRPTSDFYVNDYAKLLNESTKDYIISTNKSLYNQTGSQIVVVTVPSLDGDSLEEYATELFRNFGIGDKSKNNGVLLLLALQERQFRIEVGYGLEGVLTDGKTGRILLVITIVSYLAIYFIIIVNGGKDYNDFDGFSGGGSSGGGGSTRNS